jgi:hypothetical protein
MMKMKTKQWSPGRDRGTHVTEEAERILKLLPDLIRRDETFRIKLWQVLNGEFSSKADLAQVLQQIERSREESNRRFEESNKRFEALTTSIQESREESNKRFEELTMALRETREEVARQFESFKAEERIARRDLKHWVDIVAGGFQNRAGRSLEDAIAGTLRIALEMKDVDPAKIALRKEIVDSQGRMGHVGRSYEIDMVVADGETWFFEIKSVANREDVERFSDKVDMAVFELGLSGVRKALITLEKSDEVRAACHEHGIVLA